MIIFKIKILDLPMNKLPNIKGCHAVLSKLTC